MSRSTKGKGKSKVSASEAASRVGRPVYHAGQGRDKRSQANRPRPHALWPDSGLDSAWSVALNPHRESGTRWRAAADVGATAPAVGATHGWRNRRSENRVGDSVGAQAHCTDEGLRSVERTQRSATQRAGSNSGDTLARRVGLLCRFKGRGLIAGLVHPHGARCAPTH